jgi:hypothetical protein
MKISEALQQLLQGPVPLSDFGICTNLPAVFAIHRGKDPYDETLEGEDSRDWLRHQFKRMGLCEGYPVSHPSKSAAAAYCLADLWTVRGSYSSDDAEYIENRWELLRTLHKRALEQGV